MLKKEQNDLLTQTGPGTPSEPADKSGIANASSSSPMLWRNVAG